MSVPAPPPVRIALVLGAGGAPGGFYLRAAMAELESLTGWSPGSAATVVGTSAGAINGANLPLAEQVAAPGPQQLARLAALADGLPALPAGPTVRAGSALRRFAGRLVALLVRDGTNEVDYQVSAGPYSNAVSVVSVRRGRWWGGDAPWGRADLRRVDRLVDAADPQASILASAAVPGYSPPVVLGGRPHIDGAVHSSTNADLVDPFEHDALVVIAPQASREGGSVLARLSWLQIAEEVEPFAALGKPVVVVAPTGSDIAARSDVAGFSAAAIGLLRAAFEPS